MTTADTEPRPATPDEVFAGLRKTLDRLVAATVVLGVLLLAVAGYAIWQAGKANSALCTFRADLELRVASSQKFLREHPTGTPDIPAATIQEGILNQQRTVASLSDLGC